MAIDVFVAAKTLGIECGWSVSNLKMQKVLYVAHMAYLGKNKKRLIKTPFEAWDYGPVNPALYHKLKRFGARHVRDIFFRESPLKEGDDGFGVLRDMTELCELSPSSLIAITHREGSAWDRIYRPGELDVVIPDEFIIDEYNNLLAGTKNNDA